MGSMQYQFGVLGTISAFAFRHRETKKNLCRGGRSQDLPNTDFQPAMWQLTSNPATCYKSPLYQLDIMLRLNPYDIRVLTSTIQYSTDQYSTVQYNTVQYRTVQYSTIQYNTIQYSTVHYNTVQYSTVQRSTAQHSTVQYSTAQHSTAQHSTAQHSTVQYSTVQYKRESIFTVDSCHISTQ